MATKPRHQKTPVQLWIVDNRKRLGLTPGDLARLTGVTEDTARGWESRGKPSQDAMDTLVRTFGVKAPEDTASPSVDALGLAALLAEMREQTAATRELTLAIGQAMARIAEAEEALRQERARNRRLRRKRLPADRDGGPGPAGREDGP